MSKIFVGLVTHNRPVFFKQCFQSLSTCKIDKLAVVNDGDDFRSEDKEILQRYHPFIYIHNKQNLGVAKSKNLLFDQFLKSDCKFCFLIEDDIIVKKEDVFEQYIEAHEVTGIHHFNFGYHGPANKGGISKGKPTPRFIVDYVWCQIAINQHSVGAFCFYSREVIEKVGVLDENLKNSFDHVEHDYRIALAGYMPPYWNFPDLANSCDYLQELECSENSSTIRNREDWQKNIQESALYFKQKHGYLPAWQGCVPDTSKQDVVKILQEIKKKYATKI